MKKLITLISTKGKSKEQIKSEILKQLQEKGFLKPKQEKNTGKFWEDLTEEQGEEDTIVVIPFLRNEKKQSPQKEPKNSESVKESQENTERRCFQIIGYPRAKKKSEK